MENDIKNFADSSGLFPNDINIVSRVENVDEETPRHPSMSIELAENDLLRAKRMMVEQSQSQLSAQNSHKQF